MNILVFDTCFNKSYIVLKRNYEIVDSLIIESTEENYHSAYLIPSIKSLLQKHSLFIKDIDVIGVNIGPASFTGIRVGITLARVFAQQADIKLVGVDSLKILSRLNKTGKKTVVALDARKNKVYFSDASIPSPILLDKDELVDHIGGDSFVITDSSIHEFLKEKGIESLKYEEIEENLGLYLAEICSEKIKNLEEDFHWAKLKPLYIQMPSITKSKNLI